MGHGQLFTVVYTETGISRISPATRLDASDWQLCFTWYRLHATIVKTIVYVGLRVMLKCSTGSIVVSATSSGTCSCRVSIFGWAMMYELGHPVATLPSDREDYTSLSLND
eukprot:5833374-Pleurochrysis_carterae.AAC.1